MVAQGGALVVGPEHAALLQQWHHQVRSPPSGPLTTVIDVTPFSDDKLAALAAHAGQLDVALLLQLFKMADSPAKPAARVEEYTQAYPPIGSPVCAVERDFFDAATSV